VRKYRISYKFVLDVKKYIIVQLIVKSKNGKMGINKYVMQVNKNKSINNNSNNKKNNLDKLRAKKI
jgi:hypothetical protein